MYNARVVEVWKTSRGVFKDFKEACKKGNRAKITDRDDPEFGNKEGPVRMMVLEASTCDTDDVMYFQLNGIEVK